MMEALVTSQHKGLKFEHCTYCTLSDAMAATRPRQSRRNFLMSLLEPRSRHVVNMVTYIIYINEKQLTKQQAIEK